MVPAAMTYRKGPGPSSEGESFVIDDPGLGGCLVGLKPRSKGERTPRGRSIGRCDGGEAKVGKRNIEPLHRNLGVFAGGKRAENPDRIALGE